MKKTILLTIAVLLLASAVHADEPYGGKRNYMTFSLGGYWPNQDLDDEGYKAGADFDFSYMRVTHTWIGFGASAHTFGSQSKTETTDIGDGDFGSLGIEMLFYVQPSHWQVQPYFGIGPAIYYNFLNFDSENGQDNRDESGVGLGAVAKLGLRVFLTERFYGGLNVKGFTNSWNLDVDAGQDKTFNFGGSVLAFELGFTF